MLAALDFKIMSDEMFTILIGSYARGSGGSDSDLDVLRIGHSKSIERPKNISNHVPISYIDYDNNVFHELYDKGSLFLYHTFKEGLLLEGNNQKWNTLKNNFAVINDHTESINEYVAVLKYIDDYPEFELSYMPFLSNVFKSLKNIGIFRLANKELYVFDKKAALVEGCGISPHYATLFISANNAFERSLVLTTEAHNIHRMFAIKWKRQQKAFIKRLAYDY